MLRDKSVTGIACSWIKALTHVGSQFLLQVWFCTRGSFADPPFSSLLETHVTGWQFELAWRIMLECFWPWESSSTRFVLCGLWERYPRKPLHMCLFQSWHQLLSLGAPHVAKLEEVLYLWGLQFEEHQQGFAWSVSYHFHCPKVHKPQCCVTRAWLVLLVVE